METIMGGVEYLRRSFNCYETEMRLKGNRNTHEIILKEDSNMTETGLKKVWKRNRLLLTPFALFQHCFSFVSALCKCHKELWKKHADLLTVVYLSFLFHSSFTVLSELFLVPFCFLSVSFQFRFSFISIVRTPLHRKAVLICTVALPCTGVPYSRRLNRI